MPERLSAHPDTPPTSQPSARYLTRYGPRRVMARLLTAMSMRLSVMLVCLLLVVGSLGWLVHSERGSRQLWELAVRMSGGMVQGDWAGGSLSTGLALRQLVFQQGGMRVSMNSLRWSWHLELAPWRLIVTQLEMGNVALVLAPSSADSTPVTLPQQLVLPMGLELQALRLNTLSVTQAPGSTPLIVKALQARMKTDGVHHQLELQQVHTPYGALNGQLYLEGAQPFTLRGAIHASGNVKDAPVQLHVRASGTLAAIQLEAEASGRQMTGKAHAILAPFAAVPVQRIQLDVGHFDPRLLDASAPQADISLHADLQPLGSVKGGTAGAPSFRLAGELRLDNALPGRLDQQKLPVQSLQANVELDAQTQRVNSLLLSFPKGGQIRGQGAVQNGQGKFSLQIRNLDSHALHDTLRQTQLQGKAEFDLHAAHQTMLLQLSDKSIRLEADIRAEAAQWQMRSLQLTSGAARLQMQGQLARDGKQAYAVQAKFSRFNPAQFTRAATGSITGEVELKGQLADGLTFKSHFRIHDSEYNGLPMQSEGDIHWQNQRLLPSEAHILLAGNTLALKGSFGAAGDQLQLNIKAPQLQQLQLGVAGGLQVQADIQGTFQSPQIQGQYIAQQLQWGEHRLAMAEGRVELQASRAKPRGSRMYAELKAQGYRGPQIRLQQLDARLDGTQANHQWALHGTGQLRQQPLELELAGEGSWQAEGAQPNWVGEIRQLDSKGASNLALQAPAQLRLTADGIQLEQVQLVWEQARIAVEQFQYGKEHLSSIGHFQALQTSRLLALAALFRNDEWPLVSNLILDGQWNFNLAEQASGYAKLERRSGDITVNTARGNVQFGLSALQLYAEGQGDKLGLRASLIADRLGGGAAIGTLGLIQEGRVWHITPASPLQGSMTVSVPDLKKIASLFGPALGLEGNLSAQLQFGGKVGDPLLSGKVIGEGLTVTEFDQGIRLQDGVLRIALEQNVVDLQQVEFHGGKGRLLATGRVQLDSADPNLTGRVIAEHLQIFANPERQLILSGEASLVNLENQLHLAGKFRVDKALFDLPASSAPSIGDDVVIIRGKRRTQAARVTAGQAVERPTSRFSPSMAVEVDLGDNFRFKGAGADLRLQGALLVRSQPQQALRASGSIQAEGFYEAFGRKLTIEQGVLNFQGPLANPVLRIKAMRRNQDVEAGVEVSGDVRRPRVHLVSEPNVADEEKLSWLMFGHGTENVGLGQRSALAGAAIGYVGNALGKQLASNIGLDEFSIGSSSTGLGEQQVVSLGKAITESLTLGFEQSLSSAASVVKITWQLSRRWSLVARGGVLQGLDVQYSNRYD